MKFIVAVLAVHFFGDCVQSFFIERSFLLLPLVFQTTFELNLSNDVIWI